MCDVYPAFYCQRTRVARRVLKHRCTECQARIVPGQSYVRTTGKWEDDVATFVNHAECLSALKALCSVLEQNGIGDGCVLFGSYFDGGEDGEVDELPKAERVHVKRYVRDLRRHFMRAEREVAHGG
jgi:hypothetical protein